MKTVKRLKEVERKRISEYVKEHPTAEYREGCDGIWTIPCDIALPCATQNEIDLDSAKILVNNGLKAVGEGANMPTTPEAVDYFMENKILFAPAKAAKEYGFEDNLVVGANIAGFLKVAAAMMKVHGVV